MSLKSKIMNNVEKSNETKIHVCVKYANSILIISIFGEITFFFLAICSAALEVQYTFQRKCIRQYLLQLCKYCLYYIDKLTIPAYLHLTLVVSSNTQNQETKYVCKFHRFSGYVHFFHFSTFVVKNL